MSSIREEILEQFEEVEFLPGKDKQLVGYAEMFGNDCIPLYKAINFIACDSPQEAINKVKIINNKARVADGFDNCLIGHLKLKSGDIILLYEKDAIIAQLKKNYLEDKSGIFSDEEDCEISALEFYNYNIMGAYMEGIPAFAVLYVK